MNTILDDSRALAPEGVTDDMEVFVSPWAVRAVQAAAKATCPVYPFCD